MSDHMLWVWLAVMAAAAFVESATMTLVSVWFAVGALCAAIAAAAGVTLTSQILLFLGVSIAAFAVVRPLAKKYVDPHIVPTNADRLPGTAAKVTEDINNTLGTGAAYADGKTWTARSQDGSIVPAGETVEIVRLEGIKLIVKAKVPATAGMGKTNAAR